MRLCTRGTTLQSLGFANVSFINFINQQQFFMAIIFPALVYNMLYKDVFKMNKVDDTVNKMLHDRPNIPGRNDRYVN